MVGPERVVARITELMRDGKLSASRTVKNLSDRHTGMTITIECKPA